MIRDITLGQYYYSTSIIHRLDARTKLLLSLAFIIELFLVENFWGFLLAAIYILVAVSMSKVPLKFIFRGMKPILFILIFSFALNMFMVKGTVLVNLGIATITREGLYSATFLGIRLILLIMGTSLLTLTTKPIGLTDGLEKLLAPLKKIKVPTHEIAMMMTIALRFIPTLLDETDKIMKAQQARGADFESGNIVERAKKLVPIIIPLFVSSFRIAQDLALAMEARCYRGGEGRSRMHQMKFKEIDYIAFAVGIVFLGGIILLKVI